MMFLKRIKNWFQCLRERLCSSPPKVNATLWVRDTQKDIVAPWPIPWPKNFPIPHIGDVVMLPAPRFFISTFHNQIPTVVVHRVLFPQNNSADIFVYELQAKENWFQIAQSIRRGEIV